MVALVSVWPLSRVYLTCVHLCIARWVTRIYLSMCWSFRECLLLSLTCIQYSRCTAKCKHNIWLHHCITICQVFCSDWVYSIYAIQLHGMPRLPVTALLLRSVWNVTTSCMLHHLLFETQCVLQYDGWLSELSRVILTQNVKRVL